MAEQFAATLASGSGLYTVKVKVVLAAASSSITRAVTWKGGFVASAARSTTCGRAMISVEASAVRPATAVEKRIVCALCL